MIRIHRGHEPPALTSVRDDQLPILERLARIRPIQSEEITGYDVVKDELWKRQHYKCAYCEFVEQDKRNDVEHFRPKTKADRAPGSQETYGYWWLAFTWDNLLFVCRNCNQLPHKGIRFPLDRGSTALVEKQVPPGNERPLLLDPSVDDGVKHIEFKLTTHGTAQHWMPVARGGDKRGAESIRVCGLDRPGLLPLYTRHVNQNVWPEVEQIQHALRTATGLTVQERYRRTSLRLLLPMAEFVGLSFDALRHFVPDAALAPFGLKWRRFKL